MLDYEGVSNRFKTVGYEHAGTELRLNGYGHHIDFKELVGSTVWFYAQTEVFIDLANASERDGRQAHFGVSDVSVEDHLTDQPRVLYTDAEGSRQEIVADYLIGADGSRSMCRFLIPEEGRKQYFVEYPFAWYGISVEAPISRDELIYATSEKGFALISQRSDELQRWYLQVRPDEDAESWSDDQIFSAFDERVRGDGFSLTTGPIVERLRLPFRSFVQQPMQHRRLVLIGDAAHTVPPTGARGLNLAFTGWL